MLDDCNEDDADFDVICVETEEKTPFTERTIHWAVSIVASLVLRQTSTLQTCRKWWKHD